MLQLTLATVIALLSGTAAMACQITERLTPDRAETADFVLAGRVVIYQQNMQDSYPNEPEYAVIRLAVTEVWKGDVGAEFEFLLTTDGTWPLQDRTDWEGDVIIAASDPDLPGEAPLFRLPRVEQGICEMAFERVSDVTLAAYRDWFRPGP